MADEIELHYIDDEPPTTALQRWKTEPPALLHHAKFELVDESYNSLTYEARFTDTPMKFLMFATLGFAWLLSKISPMQTIWKITVRFDPEGEGERRTKVTIVGQASEETRAALGEIAAEHGGAVDLRVGV
jgi:hypothetical protein